MKTKTETARPALLTVAESPKGDALTTAAKNLRRVLKHAFPSVKFSVKTERFSMGDAIRVRWTDGPAQETVDGFTKAFQEGGFCGMTDSYNYKTGDPGKFNSLYGGAKYVTTSREFSDDYLMSFPVPDGFPAPTLNDLRKSSGDPYGYGMAFSIWFVRNAARKNAAPSPTS